MHVWVLSAEYTGGSDDRGVVLGVYATQELADAAEALAIAEAKEQGSQVWAHEDEDEDESAWDVDFRVEGFDVVAVA